MVFKGRPIICVDTGEKYTSLTAAAAALGMKKQALWHALKYNHRCAGKRWEYDPDHELCHECVRSFPYSTREACSIATTSEAFTT
eukprot:g27094.t1